MQNTVTVKNSQTLFDLAIQEMGDIAGVFELARANNLSITATLQSGTKIIVPHIITPVLVALYKRENISPATDGQNRISGIGSMVIGESFIVR